MCPFQSSAVGVSTFITPGTLISPGSIVGTLSLVATPGLCGNYQLYDASGNLIVSGGSNFGASQTNTFCLTNGQGSQKVPYTGRPFAGHQPKSDASFLTVYPVPASDFITIHYRTNEDTQIYIIDINNRILQQYSCEKNGDAVLTFDIADIPAGIYFAQSIVADGVVLTEKFVKK